ncbi:MAG: phage holin family protein [Cyclobacteriaceae bacterium]|nr:phage holin family protein [Cyclobacteriaceae bacterium]
MLKDTILKFLKLDGILSNLSGYVETRIELLKIEIREDIAKALAKISLFILIAFVFVLFVLFSSVALAYILGRNLGIETGFGIVAGCYFLAGLLLFLFRKRIGHWIEKHVLEITKKKIK